MAVYSYIAKQVAVQLEHIGLMVRISLLSAETQVMDAVARAMSRGCLFALFTGYQSSATLYILHGEPEGAVCVHDKLFLNVQPQVTTVICNRNIEDKALLIIVD